MTGQDIYDAALAAMGESLGGEYERDDDVILGKLNAMLPLFFVDNNLKRESRGLARLTDIPELDDLTDSIGYEPEVERTILPYALARDLLIDDEEDQLATFYNNKLYEAINELRRVPKRRIHDVY